jgi:carboxyl-terminal processing protease
MKRIHKALLIITISSASLITWGFTSDYFEITKNVDIFTTVIRELNLNYVDGIKPDDLIRKAADSMLESLDPYTEFIPESDIEDYKMNYVSKQYGGIGALIHQKDGNSYISEPYENSPAIKADLRAGDMILAINGIEIKGKSNPDISELLKGKKGTPIKLLLKRLDSKKAIEKTIIRDEIKFSNVPYFGLVNDSIGYIKLTSFLSNSAQEVKDALLALKEKNHIKGLVFDLRGNGGGILQESVAIVNLFVDKGKDIVSQKGKTKEMNVSYKAANVPVDLQIPITVLVDKNSASASEIFTGAMQELDRGVIIGQRTFGKGLVQQTVNLSYNALLKVTIAKYYTPSGRCIQALDYTHRNSDGSVDKVADSLITAFKTANGRVVYDGSGVFPDIETEQNKYSDITYVLAANLLAFDYAVKYRYAHLTIKPARDFRLTDAEYKDFLSYIKDKDYSYITESEKSLEDLKVSAEKEKSFDDIKVEYDNLKKQMSLEKKDDLIKFKDEIKELIENEIVAQYYFQKGRTESAFNYDDDIKKAISILNNEPLYKSILAGEGKYGIIGKPVMPVTANIKKK